jgi:vacuolar-type H+-ATPase subunit E/Vma4
MGNESAANLIDRIIADAKEAADRILADAETSASGIRESRDAEIAKKAEQTEKEREQQISVILNGCRTRAELDGRKETLRAKRTLLDGVFTETYHRMLAMSNEKREALFRSILQREAKENDSVAPAKVDRAVLAKTLSTLPFSVKLSDKDADAEAGFVLYGDGYEKDCSMKAILRELRDAEETNVAKILFR